MSLIKKALLKDSLKKICKESSDDVTIYHFDTGNLWDKDYHSEKGGQSVTEEEMILIRDEWLKGKAILRFCAMGSLAMGGGRQYSDALGMTQFAEDSSVSTVSVSFLVINGKQEVERRTLYSKAIPPAY